MWVGGWTKTKLTKVEVELDVGVELDNIDRKFMKIMKILKIMKIMKNL